jgi:hypothetical protein
MEGQFLFNTRQVSNFLQITIQPLIRDTREQAAFLQGMRLGAIRLEELPGLGQQGNADGLVGLLASNLQPVLTVDVQREMLVAEWTC